jgi:uncharacterized protein YecT (DUF1311 family)
MKQQTTIVGTRARAAGALFFLLLASIGAAHADDCKDANTTVQMNECMMKQARSADATLNETYRRVMASFKGADDAASQSYPASTRAALMDAQRAWVKYRDADCKAVYNQWKGGTIRDVMQLGCMKDRTEQRTRELKGFLQKSRP